MHGDMIKDAHRTVKIGTLKETIEKALADHFPADENSIGPTPVVELAEHLPEEPKSKAGRKALGAGLASSAPDTPSPNAPEAVLIRGNDEPEPQPEAQPEGETPAPRGRHRAAA